MGLDTVKLEGKYFDAQVKDGDRVKAGQLLLKFDMKALKKEGYDLITPVIVANPAKFQMETATPGMVKQGSAILSLTERG